mmetsp:Transcript_124344/g.310897  ORF Transcript_124344/g.310897 Transcript_124344/m.310897 type:complete len:248 (+) Transcript_124344:323-1066(+)
MCEALEVTACILRHQHRLHAKGLVRLPGANLYELVAFSSEFCSMGNCQVRIQCFRWSDVWPQVRVSDALTAGPLLHILRQALNCCRRHIENGLSWPRAKDVACVPSGDKVTYNLRANEVDERVALGRLALEAARQVKKIEGPTESVAGQFLQEMPLCDIGGNVPDHQGRDALAHQHISQLASFLWSNRCMHLVHALVGRVHRGADLQGARHHARPCLARHRSERVVNTIPPVADLGMSSVCLIFRFI